MILYELIWEVIFMSKKINLSFKSEGGRKSTIALDDPKEDLTTEAVTTAMNDVISSGVFEGPDGTIYATIAEAVIIETNENKIV